jgi:hypothetical protein
MSMLFIKRQRLILVLSTWYILRRHSYDAQLDPAQPRIIISIGQWAISHPARQCPITKETTWILST